MPRVLPGGSLAGRRSLPAIIIGAEQRGRPGAPLRCGKCGGSWIDRVGYLACVQCGATHHRTPTRVLPPPRTTVEHDLAAQALSVRADRKR